MEKKPLWQYMSLPLFLGLTILTCFPYAISPLDFQPHSRAGGGSELLLPVLLHYGVTDLGMKREMVLWATRKAKVGVASDEEPQGDVQLQTLLQRGSVTHVLYLGHHSGQELVDICALF